MSTDHTIIPVDLIIDMIQKKGEATLRMYGSSMSPVLIEGRQVLVKYVDPKTLHIGDIVCFELHSRLVAHRVIAFDSAQGGLTVMTKGDNVSNFDEPLPAYSILGKVAALDGKQIDGFFWKVSSFAIAKVSYLEVKILGWVKDSDFYRAVNRLKGKFRMFFRMLAFCYRLAQLTLGTLKTGLIYLSCLFL